MGKTARSFPVNQKASGDPAMAPFSSSHKTRRPHAAAQRLDFAFDGAV
jgi:hypothetical protein